MAKTRKAYSGSVADPYKAQSRIRNMLNNFGVDRVLFDENFKNRELAICFEYNNYPIALPIKYGDMAESAMKENPYNNYHRKSKSEWEKNHREIAYSAAFSIMEDFLKSLITIVEMGVFTFEEIFVSYITDNQGRRLGEHFIKVLPEMVSGQLALTGGNK